MPRILQAGSSLAALAVGALLGLYLAGPALGSGPVRPLDLEAVPRPMSSADPAADRVGRLKFLGALELKARDARFGGLSALLWDGACNRLLAASDTGVWVVLSPREQGDRLVGISEAWIAPILDRAGDAPASKRAADAESLAQAEDGAIWLFYEQDHRGERFTTLSACRPESLAAKPDRVWALPETAGWPENGGAEAAAILGDRMLLLSEQVLGPAGGRLGLAGLPEGRLASFTWLAPEGFQPTAMEVLDQEERRVLVLHRRFSPLEGVAAALLEGEFSEGAERPVAARTVAVLRPPLLVDNMEALAVRVEGERTFLYLLSDDNFNALQRTVLLKFELLPEAPAAD